MIARVTACSLSVLLLLAAAHVSADGQIPRSSDVRRTPAADTKSLLKDLDLTPAQREQVRAMTEETRAARQVILGRYRKGELISVADRATLRSIAERHNAAFLAILSPEQRARAETSLAARRAVLAQGQGRTGHPDTSATTSGRERVP